MKFLSPEVALYLYKPIIQPYMEYCCNVWAVAPSCYLELLDKLQKWKYRSIGPSLAAYLKSLHHRRNGASFSLLYRYYFGRCSESTGSTSLFFREVYSLFWQVAWFFCPRSQMLQGSLWQQFLFSHRKILGLSAYRMLSFDLWSKWL